MERPAYAGSALRVAAARRPEQIPARAASANAPATFTARLVALDERGRAWVLDELDEPAAGERRDPRSKARLARSTVPLGAEQVGREVLVCRANRAGEPVIVGVLVEPGAAGAADETGPDRNLELVVERRRVVLSAKTELVLRCGEGSITLSADGKVTIRGVDVVSSATRTQRIRGGAVRIN
jgi:hypothetical protein